MFAVQVIPEKARILLLGRGTWTVADAIQVREEIRSALELLKDGPPIRMFADLVGHHIEDTRVSDINAETGALIQAANIERYALVMTSAVVKMQARRVLAGVNLRYFDDLDHAAAWLDWPVADIERRVSITERTARAA